MVGKDAALANRMNIDDNINKAIEVSTACFSSYIGLLNIWISMDHILYDIAPKEEEQLQQFTEHKELCINDLSNPQAYKMTHF